MATILQLRRGTTVQHSTFTGAVGEVTVDTTKDTVVVHDGTTAGGKPLATEAYVTSQIQTKDNSDEITEGSTNLYFTNARARGAVSVTDSGGDGSLAYNSTTGVITYTGPSASDVRAHFSAGTGISISSGSISTSITQYTDALARGAVSVTDSGGDGSLAYNSTTGVITYTGPSATDVRAHFSAGTGITITSGAIATTITQYTDALARGAISVTDSGGDGSLAFNSTTGVITYTGPSATDVRAHFSAGTGVTITNGQVAIGQAVATNSNVTFNDLTVSGNLTVSGTTTTVNTETINLADNIITLNSNEEGTPSQNAGIEVERGTSTNVVFRWNETTDIWEYTVDGTNYIPVVGTTATQTLTNKTLTSPTMTTPTLGVASATSINKVAITAPATGSTLTIADGKTLTASNTLTFTGTDSSSVAFGAGGTVVYSGGALGTPSSATLTNATGLPVSGITASTSTAIGVGSIELGHATDTTIARSAAGVVTIEGVEIVTLSRSQTLTNKTLTSPTLTTPALGVATATSINGLTISTTTGTLTLVNGSTLATSGAFSTTLTATAATNVTLPTTGTLATLAGTETLTNKTISGASNTLSNIGNASLTNSSITLAGTAVSLGGAFTATNMLDAIKTVDGAGSGLDADLLDGNSSAYFRINVYNAAGTLLN
jgi:hypothetical protein